MAGFRIEGLDELARNLRRAAREYPEVVADVQKDCMDEVIEPATVVKVPKETTALVNSRSVDASKNHGQTPSIELTYGDSDVDGVGVDYAAAVHEILDASHAAPTGAKYVESPLEESVGEVDRRMTQASERFMNRMLG